MIIKDKIQIPGLPTKQPRKIYIYLPPEYDESDECYPVLYMFDGHNVFFDEDATYGKSWGMAAWLEKANPALMIVAVECNHEGNRRLWEYSPWDFREKRFGTVKGQGEAYMNWLTGELKPAIDRDFRTRPEREYTYISGSSMGGLMSVYAITAYNQVFSKAAALSPSLWVAPGKIAALLRDTNFVVPTQIYMDYGSEEMKYHKRIPAALKRITGAFLDKGVHVCTRIVPGGEHCEACWEEQIPVFMQCLEIKGRAAYSDDKGRTAYSDDGAPDHESE